MNESPSPLAEELADRTITLSEPVLPAAGSLIGRTLGDFVVREKIGEGGFGVVYRAEQRLLEREAVIKVLVAQGNRAVAVQRFAREAKLASRLDHPFAAHIYAFGAEPDGLLWIAMELVRGTPLNALLKSQGALPLHRFVPFFEKLCEVVQSAHEQGIIHRDLKPANVMVISRAGRIFPKLLDLGIARLRSDIVEASSEDSARPAAIPNPEFQSDLTPRTASVDGDVTSGQAVGSAQYMAPEQWTDPSRVDGRADLYSLGVLAYRCLAGKTPFEGLDSEAVREAHLNRPIPELTEALPAALNEVLRRALAKQPNERFDSALEFATHMRTASGLVHEPAALPELDFEVREALITDAPQPVAEAIAQFEVAKNNSQAVEAVRQIVRACLRYLAAIALSTRARFGSGEAAGSSALRQLFQRLHSESLDEAGWWQLTQELTRPFASYRDAHPVPELVDLFFLPTGEQLREHPEVDRLLALVRMPTEQILDSALAELVSDLGHFLRRFFFLDRYPLYVSREGRSEAWTGIRRPGRRSSALAAGAPAEGHFFLGNSDGAPVCTLWPSMQVISPSPGAPEEAFLFDGNGRHGAKMVAFPVGFERQDELFWSWFRRHIFSGLDDSRTEELRRAPYMGLSSFGVAEARFFFGREREAESFSNRLRVQSLMAAVGPSGAGKSSFVQAGVVPLLPTDWKALTMRPGPSPVAALAARLSAEGLDGDRVRASLSEDPQVLAEVLRQFAEASRKTLVLIVDQFEEIITLCSDPRERQSFAEALAIAGASAGQPVRVVLTLRDDFLIRVQQLPALRDRLAPALHLLGTPQREDLLRILEMPARLCGYGFEDPDLPREMVDAVAEQAGALALLSFTASRLWELRDRQLRLLTRKAYRALGGVAGALAYHAESTLGRMDAEHRRLVRDAFRRLVTAEGTRSVLSRKELAEVLGGQRNAERVLEQLIQARLLVASEGTGDEDRVEVIHEALLSSWPRLVQWQRDDAENARMRDALRGAAKQWNERGRTEGLLWRGEALLEYQLWRHRYPGGLTDLERAFVAASSREETRGRRIRRGLMLTAFIALALGLGVLYRANRRAEVNARVASDRLLQAHFEQGRQFALRERPQEAMAFLSKARVEGARGTAIDYLLGKAMRAIDERQVPLLGHTASILGASFSPDGKNAVTASSDNTARVWDSQSGELRFVLSHRHAVRRAIYSFDGRRILTSSHDGTAKIWDAQTGAPLVTFAHPPEVRWADLNFDATRVVTAGTRSAEIWNAVTGEHLLSLGGHPQVLDRATFSPAGKWVITIARDRVARLWNAQSGRLIAALPHDGDLVSVEFSPDGKRFAIPQENGVATVWDTESGTKLASIAADRGVLYAAAFNRDGTRLATAGDGKVVQIWEISSGKLLHRLEGHTGSIHVAAYSPDGHRLMTGGDDGVVRLWDADHGTPLAVLVGHMDTVWNAAFSRDGSKVISAGTDGTAIVWDGHRTEFEARFGPSDLEAADAAFNAKGTLLVTAWADKKIRVWDLASGALNQTVDLNATEPSFVAITADGQFAVAPDRVRDLSTPLWRLSTGEAVATLEGHDMPIDDASFSPDGMRLATISKNKIIVRDARSGKALLAVETKTASRARVIFSSDGKRILATQNRDGVVWDADTGAKLLVLSGHRRALGSVAFSADDSLILTVAAEAARLWDARTGAPVRVFEADRQELASAAISSDKALVLGVSMGGTGTVFVWEASTGTLLDKINELGGINAARFSPDGKSVVTASWKNGVKLWSISSSHKTSSEVAAWSACQVPFRLENEQLIRAKPDRAQCTKSGSGSFPGR